MSARAMSRRQFMLRAGGGVVGAAVLPGLLSGCGDDAGSVAGQATMTAPTGPPVTVDPDTPWWLQGNFAPVDREVRSTALKVTGEIPEQLAGVYARNGSNAQNADTGHWFLGDGMLHGVRMEDGEALWYSNRWINTTLYESGAGFAEAGAPGGEIGYANVSAFYHAGRLLTSGEIGFPYEVTPDDLSTVGVYDFAGRLDTSMTAHPKIDPETGDMHFFGYGFAPPYLTYHVADATGRLVHSTPIDVAATTMIHDFAITDRDVIFWEFPVVLDLDLAVGGETLPFRWDPSYGAQIGVMPLGGTGDQIRWTEVPPAYVFHGVNAFRDGDDVVVDVSQFETMFEHGPLGEAPDLHRWRLDMSGTGAPGFSDEVLGSDRDLDLATRDPRKVGRPYRYGYLLEAVDNPETVEFGGLVRRDFVSGDEVFFDPGPGRSANEGLFVPTGDDEDDGFVLTYVHDRATDGSELVILDATDIAAGPVAAIEMPQRVPHGFHAAWVPADDI